MNSIDQGVGGEKPSFAADAHDGTIVSGSDFDALTADQLGQELIDECELADLS
jgi:hypothetical protein